MSFCPSRCDSRARHFIHFETNIVANENCENCPVSNINIGKVNFTFGAHGSFIRFSNWNSQLTQNLVFIYYLIVVVVVSVVVAIAKRQNGPN